MVTQSLAYTIHDLDQVTESIITGSPTAWPIPNRISLCQYWKGRPGRWNQTIAILKPWVFGSESGLHFLKKRPRLQKTHGCRLLRFIHSFSFVVFYSTWSWDLSVLWVSLPPLSDHEYLWKSPSFPLIVPAESPCPAPFEPLLKTLSIVFPPPPSKLCVWLTPLAGLALDLVLPVLETLALLSACPQCAPGVIIGS